MTVTRRAANRHTVVSTGWTDPSNAYSTFGGNVYATLDSAKSATRSGDFGFPNITSASGPVSPGIWTFNDQGSSTIDSVAYGNGYWCMVSSASSGEIWYKADTPDGAWTLTDQGSQSFRGVYYGNGYWVAVGVTGALYYKANTPDGTWTANNQGSTTFESVFYANGYWVAVGFSGVIYYKATNPTGSWTLNTHGTNTFYDVYYDNGYWVVVGGGGALYYKSSTPDGTWTSNTQGSGSLYGVSFGNGYWVAVGITGALYYKADTPDGTWTSNTQGGNSWEDVFYANGYWVAVRGGGAIVKALTPDGSWEASATPQGVEIIYANGYWVSAGGTGDVYYKQTLPVEENPGIPDGSTINSVKVKVEWGMTALVTGGELGLQPRVNNANSGSETTKTTTIEVVDEATFGTVTLSDLRSAETSDLIEARIRVTKGSTNSAMTGNLDLCYLEVDYTAPSTFSPPIKRGFPRALLVR